MENYPKDPLYEKIKSFLDKPFVFDPSFVNRQSDIVDIILLLSSVEEQSKLIEITQKLIDSKVLDPVLLQERLDYDFLDKLKLDHQYFTKGSMSKARTQKRYTHSSFNILAEVTEGYSKLFIELSENLPLPLDFFWNNHKKLSLDVIQQMRYSAILEHASSVMTNITRIIGAFDLNPSRVLDIILIVFASYVVDYWEFFIQLLELSPWKPEVVLVDGKETRVLQITVAQIPGFKFSNRKNTIEFHWVAALLIKHQFVGINGLYAHLVPSDDVFSSQFEIYQKNLVKRSKKAERFVVPTMSGSLDDETDTPTIPAVDIVPFNNSESRRTTF